MKGDVHFMMPQEVTHAAMRRPTRNFDVRREAAALSSHRPKVACSLKQTKTEMLMEFSGNR